MGVEDLSCGAVVTAKEELRQLVESIDDDLAELWLDYLRTGSPALRAALYAPLDDEPETDEERDAAARRREALADGRVYTNEQMRARLGR